MSIEEFIREYFFAPIEERSGYNVINTAVYAAIALLAAYIIFKALKRLGIKTDKRFAYSIVPFVLFGSTLRVVVDANILPYNYFTTTPGIYIVVGLITLATIFLLYSAKRLELLSYVGIALFLPSFILLLPLFKHLEFFTFILILASLGTALGNVIFNSLKLECTFLNRLVVFSHALDGAATYVSIDVFSKMRPISYFEQHVVTNALAQAFGGFWIFYLVKVAFAIAAVYLLEKSSDVKEDERYYVMLLLVIFGLAPGVRDSLRLLCGV